MTKRILSLALIVLMIFSCSAVCADDEIILAVNNTKLTAPVAPMLKDGTTMVPVATIFRAIGYNVEWNEANKSVIANNGVKTIILTVDKKTMIVDSRIINLDKAPFIENGTTFVPVRAVCDALDCDVDWNGEYRAVIITTADYTGEVYNPANDPDLKKAEVEVNPQEKPPVSSGDSQGNTTLPETTYTPTIDPDPVYFTKDNGMFTTEIISLVNDQRELYNCPRLVYDEDVAAVANDHSKEMAMYDYIGHYSSNNEYDPFDRLDLANISYMSAAENLASGFTKPEDVVNSWMKSEKHKNVILNPEFTHIGVGYSIGGSNGTYWTMVVISR